MIDKESVLARIRECGLVAVIRAQNTEQALRISEACMKGGVAGIELTYTVPNVTETIAKLAMEYKGSEDFVIGAGTIMDEQTARTAILAGAQYIVSPYFRTEIVKLCNRYRVPVMPGAMTIKEIVEAMEGGADIIKIFPGELCGPSIIRAVRGPLPYAKMMPTGGVTLENAAAWISAGAVALGVGSSLTEGAGTGDYDSITTTAIKFIDEIKVAREGK